MIAWHRWIATSDSAANFYSNDADRPAHKGAGCRHGVMHQIPQVATDKAISRVFQIWPQAWRKLGFARASPGNGPNCTTSSFGFTWVSEFTAKAKFARRQDRLSFYPPVVRTERLPVRAGPGIRALDQHRKGTIGGQAPETDADRISKENHIVAIHRSKAPVGKLSSSRGPRNKGNYETGQRECRAAGMVNPTRPIEQHNEIRQTDCCSPHRHHIRKVRRQCE